MFSSLYVFRHKSCKPLWNCLVWFWTINILKHRKLIIKPHTNDRLRAPETLNKSRKCVAFVLQFREVNVIYCKHFWAQTFTVFCIMMGSTTTLAPSSILMNATATVVPYIIHEIKIYDTIIPLWRLDWLPWSNLLITQKLKKNFFFIDFPI